MANHPNRAAATQVEPTAAFVLESAGALVASAAKLIQEGAGSEGYERARKRALRSARQAMSALRMMGPEGEHAAGSE